MSWFVGEYLSQGGVEVTIEARDDALVLIYPDRDEGPYRPGGLDRFVLDEWPAWIWHIRFEDVGTNQMRVIGSDQGWLDDWQLFRLP